VTPTQASADWSRQDADRDRDREREREREEQVSTLTIGMVFIMRTAFPMFIDHDVLRRLSMRQQRRLETRTHARTHSCQTQSALPEQRGSTAKKNEPPRATNEKRGGGWFQGLKQKLQRTGSRAAEEETTKVETEKEKEKEAEEKEDDAEEEEGEEEHEARDKLRVVVSFALLHQ
jgi:hypothetical protein